MIRDGEVTSREVVERHIETLMRADVNAVVVERFDEALAEADVADERVAAARRRPAAAPWRPVHDQGVHRRRGAAELGGAR